jgi:ElaB protein
MNTRVSTNSTSPNPIARDFQNVVDDAHELLKTVQVEGGAKVNEARSKLQESFDVAREKLAEATTTAQDSAKKYAAQTDEYVHAHPWQAIGAGAAVGALIGFLLARR